MRGEAAARYAPAILAPLGALNPIYAGIAFGMVSGWLAIIGVMVERQRPAREIMRALAVSLLIGGGGALFAAFAVNRMHADPLTAALLAFGIAFGGVRTIKLLAGSATGIVNWVLGSLIDDAAKLGHERQKTAQLQFQADRENHERIGLKSRIEDS